MSTLFQAICGVLVAVVLISVLERCGREMAVLLSVAACGLVLLCAVSYLSPLITLIRDLAESNGLNSEWIAILLKTVAVALVSQFAALICTDSGNSAMAKAVEILASGAILWLSIPLITAILELIQELMGTG